MGTLKTPSRFLCREPTEISVIRSCSAVGQVGFGYLYRNRKISKGSQSLVVKRRSYTEERNGEDSITSGRNSQDEEQRKGLLLGTERDNSGSVIGFQLIPHSGKVCS